MPPVQAITAASTEAHTRVSVTIDGHDEGLFDVFDGGSGGSPIIKYRPGGSAVNRNALPGPIDYDDATLTRFYVSSRDYALFRRLLGREGRAKVLITEQDLDENLAPINRPTTYRGTLTKCTKPKTDSGANAIKLLTLTVSIESVA